MKPVRPDQVQRARTAALALLVVLYVAMMAYQFADLKSSVDMSDNTTVFAAIEGKQALDSRPVMEAAEVQLLQQTPAPSPAPTTVINGRETMVFIVNYRDSKRCGETLRSMFENAKEPELLRVSLHDQIFETEGDIECVESYCQLMGNAACRRSQVISTKVDANDAKGPTVARFETEKALGDEEFCLGLDSHMVFVAGWDEQLVHHWDSIANPHAILTMYPKSSEMLEDHSMDHKMGLMCDSRVESKDFDAVIQYLAVRWLDRTSDTKPRLMSQFAGGFNFGRCQSYKEVPNDPQTPILFYGEEYTRAARLWTAGYDFYAPSIDVIYHWYEKRGKIWDHDWSKRFQLMMRSRRRIRHLLGLPVSSDDFDHTDLDKYGLGSKRTFDQWKQFTGIDPLAKYNETKYEQFNNCGELELVPWLEPQQ